MKRILVVLLLTAVLASCSSKVGESISLYNNVEFQMMSEEAVVADVKNASTDFTALTSEASIQIPLFKKVANEELDIFIGLPVGLDFSTIGEQRIVSKEFESIDSSSDAETYSYRSYKGANSYIVEYIVRENKSTFYTLFKTDSEKKFKSDLSLEKVRMRYNK